MERFVEGQEKNIIGFYYGYVCENMENNRPNIMGNIIIMSPLLKKRFEKMIEYCKTMNGLDKPDNVTWEEIILTYLIVVTENYQRGNL